MTTTNAALREWVAESAKLAQPDSIHWCTGSDVERDELTQLMLSTGDLLELNQATFPNCYLHRSNPSDVARVEHLTFICTKEKEDAGPNNNWMDPAEAHRKVDALFAGCMKGRTMYVVPYCMGPITSPYARCGVEITDSPYVVLNMRIMTRMGAAALARIEKDGTLREGPALGRRPEPRPPPDHAFPRRTLDQEHRLRLRRQRAARQEVPCTAHRELPGAHRGLAGRAHADRRHREPARRGALHRGGVPVGLRQDQPRHADPARHDAGLEGLDHRRGHRVAARRVGRPPARDQPGGRFLRRRAGHEPEDEPQRLRDDPPRHDLHERRGDGGQRAVVGRPHHRRAGHRLAGPPLRQGERTRPRTRTRASRCRPSRTPPTTT